MRILQIHNFYKQAGGEDTVFEQEAQLLRAHGHTVEQLTFSNNNVTSIKDKLQAALGVVYNPQSAGIISKSIKRFKPDVVHVHNFFPLVSPGVFWVCRKYKVPVVMTLHNYRLLCPSAVLYYDGQVQLENVQQRFPLKPILKGVYRGSKVETASVVLATGVHKLLGTWRGKVNKFIALTPGAAALFQNSSLHLRPEQLSIKPNFTADPGLGAATREDYFLYLGRLTEEKGIRTLLKAHTLKPFPLRIIGTGPLQALVEAYAAKHPAVEYMGFRPREEAMEQLKKARALIFPSEWLETFGMTAVEAFATGTPVIASKIGGGAHLVQHQHNGMHYTPGDAQELVRQVELLQQLPDLARALGQNARNDYEQLYTPDINCQMLVSIYEDAIGLKKQQTSLKEIAQL
ncbi:glycosyltransferase involved in cell wall biosynthesis [Pontibacter mucosus]|uniref:Glycosyltransferase involved in cell wall biosynthesis n=1 Tax=Pontibacter mucosus TaxID=1649266 RepID=A0A2T5YPZ0_9BACT|nr:glycosyltransferase [Pontibacter mucosus]PTX21366.1 glycosyltransferase involved in cell wall biosynthesis [Pontibacter mucosus]